MSHREDLSVSRRGLLSSAPCPIQHFLPGPCRLTSNPQPSSVITNNLADPRQAPPLVVPAASSFPPHRVRCPLGMGSPRLNSARSAFRSRSGSVAVVTGQQSRTLPARFRSVPRWALEVGGSAAKGDGRRRAAAPW
ncbi:hypothetical protein GN956_G18934 [Arapaima gigas]